MKLKKNLCVLLCACLLLGLVPVGVLATNRYEYAEAVATELKTLGLFQGVSDSNFDLYRAPSRVEALVMLIRLLGRDENARNSRLTHPFTDVPGWANGYVGYAYQEKLTNGVSDTSFGEGIANSAAYLTYVLRALGYSDRNNEDFSYSDPYMLAGSVGLLPSEVRTTNFLRADVVLVSYAALSAKLKDSGQTLADKLIGEGVFTRQAYQSAQKKLAGLTVDEPDPSPTPAPTPTPERRRRSMSCAPRPCSASTPMTPPAPPTVRAAGFSSMPAASP